MTKNLTDARRRGLAVLVEDDRRGAITRVSNETSAAPPRVYWQTARWLLDEGLAEARDEAGDPAPATPWAARIALTARGRQVARDAGLL